MKSLVWTGANVMEMKETTKPEVGERDVLIKVKIAGVCGSEIEGYLGNNSLRMPPLIMGHEFSGDVVEIGNRVKDISVGQRVVINPLLSCGRCHSCLKGLENLCETRALIGIHRSGAFADYTVVPASAVWKIPDNLDYTTASLAEPLACSLRAVRRVMTKHPFANVVVYGAGTIGLLSALVAQLMGASHVIILDIQRERLQTAKDSGVAHTLLSNQSDLKKQVEAITGEKGIDAIIDAAGFLPTRQQAFELINAGGTIMNIGLGIDETPLPINVAVRQEIAQEGSFSYTSSEFYEAINLLASRQITHDHWSEIRYLEEGNDAFQDLVNNRVAKAKIFLSINAADT